MFNCSTLALNDFSYLTHEKLQMFNVAQETNEAYSPLKTFLQDIKKNDEMSLMHNFFFLSLN